MTNKIISMLLSSILYHGDGINFYHNYVNEQKLFFCKYFQILQSIMNYHSELLEDNCGTDVTGVIDLECKGEHQDVGVELTIALTDDPLTDDSSL